MDKLPDRNRNLVNHKPPINADSLDDGDKRAKEEEPAGGGLKGRRATGGGLYVGAVGG